MGKLYESIGWVDGPCYKFGNIKCYPMIAMTGKFRLYTFEKINKLKVQVGNKSRVIYFKEVDKMKWMDTFRTEVCNMSDRWKFDNNTIPFWVFDGRFTYTAKDKEEINKLFYALFV